MSILEQHIDLFCKNKIVNESLFYESTLVIGQQGVYAEEKDVLNIISNNNINYSKHKKISKNNKLTQT
jgi:hypothetical protein